MRSVASAFGLGLLVFGLGGCGGSSDVQPVDVNKPLEGKELADADQLEGVWLAQNPGDFIGFEFMDDGQVLATPLNGSSPGMYKYSVIQGGRLSLVTPNGRSQVYQVELSGSQFELKGTVPGGGGGAQRFVRLPKGQTLEQGMEQYAKAREAEYEKRYDAVNKFLRQPDLVITATSPAPDAPAAMAIEVTPSGAGKAWHDDTPAHLDEIRTSIESDQGMPTVQVGFGKQIQPATAENTGGGSVTFIASGDMAPPTLLAQATFGNKNVQLALKQDAKLHHEIVTRFTTEMARIEALRKPIADLLKDFAVLEGTNATDNPVNYPKGSHDHMVLVRDPVNGTYTGQSVLVMVDSGSQVNFPKVWGEIKIADDKPLLIINTPVRQYQLSAAGNKLTGGWFNNGGGDGYQSEFSIARAVDKDTYEKENAAQKAALLALNPSTPFVGFVNTMQGVNYSQVRLTRLTLTVQPDGNVKAEARFPVMNGIENMTGTIVDSVEGPILQLQYADFNIDGKKAAPAMQAMIGRLRSEIWTLKVGNMTPGKVTLDGSATNVGDLAFVQLTDAWSAEQLSATKSVLTAGADFAQTIPPNTYDDPDPIVKFKLDPATNKITGTMTSAGHQFARYIGTTYAGELTQIEGFPVLTLQANSPPAAHAPANQPVVLFAVQKPGGIHLEGYVGAPNGRGPQSEFDEVRK